jgi:hypothetical protein
MNKKTFYLDVEVSGTATLMVKASDLEEAKCLFKNGDFEESDCYYNYDSLDLNDIDDSEF